ncbi:30S ribosomal protein S1 [Clostridium chauvoei]|uniref:30S ribosomal protein S1 n=2 Tax=Clostridium chauvoei TaxID=46867 RepID=A0ABD4RH81_9CLOT|nr:30S ribosomal protein S1 [Clostridium chauvoei]ATD56453.1 30S ribosomal protein S1 [Clostridium chauvoei]MBX7280237.1 30S ribosomal protein S1 [Clostridium chauvoei]MBX7282653.1 30S ribosomal protein S1 [Clostridium chauvoei]MBX7285128.1 30S ribosomal protein S1 [Clostridium chauvoei]MBX7287634.1 30S ribosomal protein S1 [Clostridium chauvoei]
MINQTGENSMKELLNDFDVKRINKGDILEGKVIDVNDKEVTVNINYAFDGVISKEELTTTSENPCDVVKSGDKISVYVISPNDGEGYVLLSRVRALAVVEKDQIVKAFKNEEVINVKVKEEVKGGLVAYYGSTRVFIPASLASRERVELKTLIGKDLEVKLTEVDFKNRRVVASRRVLEDAIYEANKKKIWNSLKAGEKRNGVVKKILKVGAIVDIGGITGLIHINDLAWGRVKRVEDVVNVNDKVEVVIGQIDATKERVSLILKDVSSDPWVVNTSNLKVGDVLAGKVVKLLSFGAFVELYPGVEGLVHLSEITEEHIAKQSDVLTIGQEVKVKVLDYNKENKKIALTIKDAEEKSKEYLKYNDSDEGVSLGDLFKGMF